MSESIDEIINAIAMKLQDAGLHDEGCFLVHELAADLFHMTQEGSAVNPAQPPVSDVPDILDMTDEQLGVGDEPEQPPVSDERKCPVCTHRPITNGKTCGSEHCEYCYTTGGDGK